MHYQQQMKREQNKWNGNIHINTFEHDWGQLMAQFVLKKTTGQIAKQFVGDVKRSG